MNRTEPSGRGTANVCAQTTNGHETQTVDFVRLLARLLAPFIAAELSAVGGEWIDQHRSPLGKRPHCELARSGAFPARRVGRRWLARRADVDCYIEAQRTGAPLDLRPANDSEAHAKGEDAGMRAALAEVGLEPFPARARMGRQ